MKFVLDKWDLLSRKLTSRKRAVAALGLLRSVVGLLGVAYYIGLYGKRYFLLGNDGVFGQDATMSNATTAGTWSLYRMQDDLWWFDCIFYAGLACALLTFLGIGGRLILALHYAFLWSTYMQNPFLLDGGDNIIMIIVPFLLLTRCYQSFSLLNILRVREAPRNGSLAIGFHNCGALLIMVQICIVYLMAGLYKVQGQLWQDGTALYYILRTPEFNFPAVTPLLFHFDILLVVGAYLTVLWSIFFPIMVVFKRGRKVAVFGMMLFHMGIAILMGLTSFALIMIAVDLLFVSSTLDLFRENSKVWWRRTWEVTRPTVSSGSSSDGVLDKSGARL